MPRCSALSGATEWFSPSLVEARRSVTPGVDSDIPSARFPVHTIRMSQLVSPTDPAASADTLAEVTMHIEFFGGKFSFDIECFDVSLNGIRNWKDTEMSISEIRIRAARDRGVAEHGWLSSRHSFSFASYYDPEHMGFRSLRVINDDKVQPGQGFGTHPHRDMEILSVVVGGALEHRDSLGTGSVIRPGEVQRMTAGSGILHSEFNPSPVDEVRFLQIWIEPERRGLEPSYEQKPFDAVGQPNKWLLVASPNGRDGSLTVHQDVAVFRAALARGADLEYALAEDRHAWIQVIDGELDVNGRRLESGDGAAIQSPRALELRGRAESSDLLLFDLA